MCGAEPSSAIAPPKRRRPLFERPRARSGVTILATATEPVRAVRERDCHVKRTRRRMDLSPRVHRTDSGRAYERRRSVEPRRAAAIAANEGLRGPGHTETFTRRCSAPKAGGPRPRSSGIGRRDSGCHIRSRPHPERPLPPDRRPRGGLRRGAHDRRPRRGRHLRERPRHPRHPPGRLIADTDGRRADEELLGRFGFASWRRGGLGRSARCASVAGSAPNGGNPGESAVRDRVWPFLCPYTVHLAGHT
jgi:hypothetical protein